MDMAHFFKHFSRAIFIFAVILFCGCGGDRETGKTLNIKPASRVAEGNCELGIDPKTCKLSATMEGFETNVKVKKGNKGIRIRDMNLELLDAEGRPLNGWPNFSASAKDLRNLENTDSGFVTFSMNDLGKLTDLFAELLEKDGKINTEKLKSTRELEKKLKNSGAKKFAIRVDCY
jgi:hypothetical protein